MWLYQVVDRATGSVVFVTPAITPELAAARYRAEAAAAGVPIAESVWTHPVTYIPPETR